MSSSPQGLVAAPVDNSTTGANSGLSPPASIRDQGYTLVKNWDFGVNVRSLDDFQREFYTRFDAGGTDTLPGNGEWERYRENDNHRIVGDELQLIARIPGGITNGGIESGMLRSKWVGKYGYYEIRMKVPPGRGMWPAFWVVSDDQLWPPEIDALEIVNNGRDTTRNSFHNLITGKGQPAPETVSSKVDQWGSYHPAFDYAEGFHTFAIEWLPDRVRHFVDGILVVERTFQWLHSDGRDGGPAHILANLAVGGDWPGAPTNPADFPAVLHVDYIRVWQK